MCKPLINTQKGVCLQRTAGRQSHCQRATTRTDVSAFISNMPFILLVCLHTSSTVFSLTQQQTITLQFLHENKMGILEIKPKIFHSTNIVFYVALCYPGVDQVINLAFKDPMDD